MSTILSNSNEALSTLKLLVALAKADGDLSAEERQVFQGALAQFKLPTGTTAKGLIDGNYSASSISDEITSKEGREAAYTACYTLANADHKITDEEQAVLKSLEKAWGVSSQRKGLLNRILNEARDTVSLSAIKPIANAVKREAEVKEDILKYSTLAGALGLFPIPIAKLATELAVIGVQGKMVRDIGQYHGQETTQDGAKQLLVGMGAGHVARIALNTLLGFVPIAGSVIPAAANFASTYAVGKVAHQYFTSGGKLDPAELKKLFTAGQKEGKEAYAASKDAVAAKAQANKALLDSLAAEYKAGKITQAEYEKRVLDLK